MIEILSRRFKTQYHDHRCPRCKRVNCEPNDVCGKTSGPHVFICLTCLQDYRLRLGTDVLLDSYLDHHQLNRLQEVAPDEKANALDLVDNYRKEQQIKEIRKLAAERPPVAPPTVQQRAQKTHEEIEKLREEATIVTYEEAHEELKKIAEEEKVS